MANKTMRLEHYIPVAQMERQRASRMGEPCISSSSSVPYSRRTGTDDERHEKTCQVGQARKMGTRGCRFLDRGMSSRLEHLRCMTAQHTAKDAAAAGSGELQACTAAPDPKQKEENPVQRSPEL